MSLSVIHPNTLEDLKDRLRSSLSLPGNVAEAGVYKGGSALVEAKEMEGKGKLLFLLDTFTGIPDAVVPEDSHKPGDFGDVQLEAVKDVLAPYDFARIYPGLFKDTLQLLSQEQFCFVHVDCDLYSSVKECCEFFYDRVVPGGIILFDDYGSPTCKGAKKAVDEFFAGRPEWIEAPGHGPVFVKKV